MAISRPHMRGFHTVVALNDFSSPFLASQSICEKSDGEFQPQRDAKTSPDLDAHAKQYFPVCIHVFFSLSSSRRVFVLYSTAKLNEIRRRISELYWNQVEDFYYTLARLEGVCASNITRLHAKRLIYRRLLFGNLLAALHFMYTRFSLCAEMTAG